MELLKGLHSLLNDLGVMKGKSIMLYIDNELVIFLAEKGRMYRKLEALLRRCHVIRDGDIHLKKIAATLTTLTKSSLSILCQAYMRVGL